MSKKKDYSSPGISFVNLAVVSSVSESCNYSANSMDESCLPIPHLDNEWSVYVSGCIWIKDPSEVCYHVPMGDNNVFHS